MSLEKKTLLILFGGRSTEHEISCLSCYNVVSSIDRDKYDLCLIGISKEGSWILAPDISSIKDGSWRDSKVSASLLPDAVLQSVLIQKPGEPPVLKKIDIIFPILHGKNGEDGTVQGLFELCHIPYVGCGVLSSAISMDKLYTKLLCDKPLKALGVRQARYLSFRDEELRDTGAMADIVERDLSYPVFVKPSNAGSSCGISKANDRDSLIAAFNVAEKVDRRIIVEEAVVGRELECAVFNNEEGIVKASGVGEILSAGGFYDYDSKYNNPASKTSVHPILPEGAEDLIRKAAIEVFNIVDGWGLSRVDFFLDSEGVVFNEINTMPGFTSISMYPMLWEDKGIKIGSLVEDLIGSTLSRPEREIDIK